LIGSFVTENAGVLGQIPSGAVCHAALPIELFRCRNAGQLSVARAAREDAENEVHGDLHPSISIAMRPSQAAPALPERAARAMAAARWLLSGGSRRAVGFVSASGLRKATQ